MPKPEWIRVRLNENGAHVSVRSVRDGMTVLKQPGADVNGRPLPAKYPEPTLAKKKTEPKTSAATPAAASENTTTGGGSATSKEDSK